MPCAFNSVQSRGMEQIEQCRTEKLNEFGIWSMEERLMYRKMMLYRLCRKIIEDQEQNEEVGTFYDKVKIYFNRNKIDIKDVKSMTKRHLNGTIKE